MTDTVTAKEAVAPEDFVAFCKNPELAHDVFTPDFLYDANVPSWRFQLQGPDAMAEHIRTAVPIGDFEATIRRSSPTSRGWVAEIGYQYTNAQGVHGSYRSLFLAELRGGKISELTNYCTGLWTAETRARHAAEVTLIHD